MINLHTLVFFIPVKKHDVQREGIIMEKSDVTSMRKSKSHEGGIAELLNFKQKNKDMNEFIKVPMSEKLAYCFGDPALTLIYTITTTLLTYFLHERCRHFCRCGWYDFAAVACF